PTPFLATLNTAGTPTNIVKFTGTNIALADDDAYTGGALFAITSLPPSPGVAFGTIDNDGKTISGAKTVNGTAACTLQSIARHTTGDLFLSGYSTGGDLNLGTKVPNRGAEDIFIAHITDTGTPVSGQGYGNDQPQFGRNVRSDAGGHLYVFGDFKGDL